MNTSLVAVLVSLSVAADQPKPTSVPQAWLKQGPVAAERVAREQNSAWIKTLETVNSRGDLMVRGRAMMLVVNEFGVPPDAVRMNFVKQYRGLAKSSWDEGNYVAARDCLRLVMRLTPELDETKELRAWFAQRVWLVQPTDEERLTTVLEIAAAATDARTEPHDRAINRLIELRKQ